MEGELTFEEALERLENVVETLSEGKLTLDEALEKFQEGVELFKICRGKLKEAEQKISVLLEDEEGIVEKPLKFG